MEICPECLKSSRPDRRQDLRGLCSIIATGRLNGAPRRDPRRSDDPLRADHLLIVGAKRGEQLRAIWITRVRWRRQDRTLPIPFILAKAS
jgi:hypothetical protein